MTEVYKFTYEDGSKFFLRDHSVIDYRFVDVLPEISQRKIKIGSIMRENEEFEFIQRAMNEKKSILIKVNNHLLRMIDMSRVSSVEKLFSRN